MVCGGCGATIADKAIVCYRCGTPTAIPAVPPREGGVRPRPALWPALLLVLVAVAAGWFSLHAPSRSWLQMAEAVVAALAALSGVYLIVRPRR